MSQKHSVSTSKSATKMSLQKRNPAEIEVKNNVLAKVTTGLKNKSNASSGIRVEMENTLIEVIKMVRNYKKKTKRGEWSIEAMKKAIDNVLTKKSGFRKAAAGHGVPQTTLERYVTKMKQGGEVKIGVPLGPLKSVFNVEEEEELAAYLKHMEARLFGLTSLDLRRMAYKLAVKNYEKHTFSSQKKMAGYDWLKGFLKRHPNLSVRKPEATSAARAMGFNKVAVGKFYQLLGKIYDEHKLTPNKIYNCDETGISVVSKTKSKIIAMKGRKQVGSLSSAERGQTITVEICLSAAGTYMPPLMIFPRQRMKAELLDHAPPGTTAACNPRGWMTTDVFTIWFKQFIHFSGASLDNKVLLLLDGHVSHTKNLEVIDLARQNGVIILCFPPHCTHRLQPADVGFMRPLSSYYDHAATNWLRSHPGRVLTVFQISEIFGQAYLRAATMTTAINAFKKCGIWPYNQDNFTDADFLPAETTNIPLDEDRPSTSDLANIRSVEILTEPQPAIERQAQSPDNIGPQPAPDRGPQLIPVSAHPAVAVDTSLPDYDIPTGSPSHLISSEPHSGSPHASEPHIEPEPNPSCSYTAEARSPIQRVCRDLSSSFKCWSPRDVIPIPSVQAKEKRKQYRRGKTAVITSTPYKKELEDIKRPATKIADSKKKAKNTKNGSTGKNNANQEDTFCLYCNDFNNTYLKSSENWVACQLCGYWAHTACAGVDDDNVEDVLICVFCESK